MLTKINNLLVIQRLPSFKYKTSMLTRAKEISLKIYKRYDGAKRTSNARKGKLTIGIINRLFYCIFYFYFTL